LTPSKVVSGLFSIDGAYAASGEIKLTISITSYDEGFSKVGPAFEKKTGIKLAYIDVVGNTRADFLDVLKKDNAKIIKVEMPEGVIDGKRTGSPFVTMQAVLKGHGDAGVGSTPFAEWSKQAKTMFPVPLDRPGITHRTIGHGLIKVFAHKGVGVKELSFAQLESIFTAKVKNWKDLGGSGAPISWNTTEGATTREATFKKLAMSDKEFGLVSKRWNHIEDLVKGVGATPGAISYLPESYIEESASRSQILEIKTPDMGRPIVMITKGKPSDDVLKLLGFISSPEGSALIK
jgi:phosphate transport system substrate-binding protein